MCAKLIHAVLILQMLAHSIFGCCWHHAHSVEGAACHHEVIATQEHEKHACNHHGQERPLGVTNEASRDSDQLPDRSLPCGGIRCLFVKSESSPLSSRELRWLCGGLSSSEMFASVRLPDLDTVGYPGIDRSGHSMTPVRRCALLRAWLI